MKRLSDREILRGALGGWIAHDDPKLVGFEKAADGSTTFTVKIRVSKEAAAKAREEFKTKTGGWAGTK